MLVGDAGNHRHVGHFEGLRAGRFHHHHACVRLDQRLDAGADQRIEIGGLDAIARQHAIAEIAGRAIGAVGHEDVVAGLKHGQQRRGDRRKAGGHEAHTGAARAFQRHQRLLQCLGRGGAVPAILILAAMGMQVVSGRIKDGGAPDRRWIDEAPLACGVAAGGDNHRIGIERRGAVIVG